MFKGRYNYSADSKGRTSLPAKFRETMSANGDESVVLTFALDSECPHLDVYSATRWREFEQNLSSKPMFDKNIILLKRLYVANAVETSIDGHGRILIPATHREYAQLGQEITWVGMTKNIEIWSPALWNTAQSEALLAISNVRDGLAGFDL